MDAPVLLAGDIDRGGVFAQLYGTVALLEPEERARIKGLVINKFRGDVEILRPGLAPLEEKTGVPVVGVVPYVQVEIDDEDSLAPGLACTEAHKPLDVAVVRLPRISNFITGLVINKFRGDGEILRPGLAPLEQKTGIPVVGVVPYVRVEIDDEDSLAPGLDQTRVHKPLDVAVIRLPRISNFTDFAPLEQHPLVGVRYVTGAQALGTPDAVILPGTKSTLSDLLWLRQSGLEAALLKLAAAGTPVLGICLRGLRWKATRSTWAGPRRTAGNLSAAWKMAGPTAARRAACTAPTCTACSTPARPPPGWRTPCAGARGSARRGRRPSPCPTPLFRSGSSTVWPPRCGARWIWKPFTA